MLTYLNLTIDMSKHALRTPETPRAAKHKQWLQLKAEEDPQRASRQTWFGSSPLSVDQQLSSISSNSNGASKSSSARLDPPPSSAEA